MTPIKTSTIVPQWLLFSFILFGTFYARIRAFSLVVLDKSTFWSSSVYKKGLRKSSTRSLFPTRSPTVLSSPNGDIPQEVIALDPLVVYGPSGVGKGTLIGRFMQDNPWADEFFEFAVSHTTRNPREGEQNSVHYHFIQENDMKDLIEDGAFIESAQVYGNWYGTSWSALQHVQLSGKRCLLDIDKQGVQSIQKLIGTVFSDKNGLSYVLYPKFLFIAPPSFETLAERLAQRGSETPDSFERRLRNAKAEIEYGMHSRTFDYILVNDDVEQASKEFVKAVRELYGL